MYRIPMNNLVEVNNDNEIAEGLYASLVPLTGKFNPYAVMSKIRKTLDSFEPDLKITYCARAIINGLPLFALIWKLPKIKVGKTATVYAYVYNHRIPEFSEFGTIAIKREEDGYHYIA